MTKLERLEELKIQYEQLCWLIEHTETTEQLKLLQEVCSGFQFKDGKKYKKELDEEKLEKENEWKRREIIELNKKVVILQDELEEAKEEKFCMSLLAT